MATSDNVIRAGLTPKLRDVPNLVAGLTYIAADPKKHLVQPSPTQSAHSTLYNPPIPEFAVLRVVLQPSETESHPPVKGPSIAIVTEGKGFVRWGIDDSLQVSEGEAFFVGAGAELKLEGGKDGSFIIYRAFVEA
jgi:mannose-6-phosphate isomerase